MNCDSHYWKGHGHRVCEDYARHVECDVGTFVAVSDGCSSAPDTDIGARLIATSALSQLRSSADLRSQRVNFPMLLENSLRLVPYGIHTDCLHATLLTIQPTWEGVKVSVAGDGFVLFRHRDTQLIEVFEVDYSDMPAYPLYLHESKRDTYFGNRYGHRVITRHLEGEDVLPMSDKVITPETLNWEFHVPSMAFDLIMVCTDGIKTFRDAEGSLVPVMTIAKHLMDVRNPHGEFVQRGANFFLKRVVAKQGWTHYDDIGLGAIYMPEEDRE